MKFINYILRKFIPFFIGALLVIAFIINIVDLFINITKYSEMHSPVKDILMVMVYYAPKCIWYGAPIACLFSVTYILSDLYANNEMTALFASGTSLLAFILPMLVCAIGFSFGMFYLEDKLVVTTLEKKNTLQNQLLGTEESANNENVVVISEGAKIVYKVGRYRDNMKRLEDIYLVYRNDNKTLDSIIYSKIANWNEEKQVWDLQEPIQYKTIGDTLEIVPVDVEYTNRLTESYEIFKRKSVDIESVSVKEAKVYIDHLKKAGLPYNEQLSVYYKKFAFPFILFIAAFLAVGVTGKTRKNVLLISLSLSIVAVVLYYVFQMMTMVLAKTGVITPFMGAWFPNIVFTFISFVLLKYSRT